MSAGNPFTAAKLAALREDIRREGLQADKFLTSNPDCQSFGLNLACAWPFPDLWRESYERLAQRLRALGSDCYVYPFPFTHVTLVTFVSFARYTQPAAELRKALEGKIPDILDALSPLFALESPDRIRRFSLFPQSPVLTRSAGILPFLNPDGEVGRLRQWTLESLQRNELLHRELTGCGLNVPGIIHSSVLRFRKSPSNLEGFLAAFDEIVVGTSFPPVEVGEILLTSEMKPYMRGGEILWRFKLAAGPP